MLRKKLLVTGGSGFIGSEVVHLGLQSGLEILNLDFRAPNIPEHAPYWSNVDVRTAADVEREVSRFEPQYILHMASDIDVTLKSLDQYRTTTQGTANVLAAAARLPGLERLVHVSTQFVVTPGLAPSSETDFRPYTLYGEAKALSEKLVRQTELPFLIARPTIIWGPRHPTFHQQILAYIASRAYLHPRMARPILRCYGYVENTAAQMLSLLAVPMTSRRVFYLGDATINYDTWVDGFSIAFTGKPARRIPSTALHALAYAGSAMKQLGLPAPIDLGRYFRMTTSSEIDLSSTFAVSGTPRVSREVGLVRTVEWLRELDPARFGPRSL